MPSKKKKWTKFRHKVITALLRFPLGLYINLTYGIKIEKFKDQGKRNYLILYNHQTAFDQFFVGLTFKGPVYYLASEDLFSNGFVSRLIKYLVEPIPIKKQAGDVAAVKNCIRIAREGATIAIAPEGNRTYSGKTEYMSPAIADLAKKLGLPIALLRIEGGYGVHPRWSDVLRKGKMKAYISRVIEPEEYKKMTSDELFCEIESGLFVDETTLGGCFESKKRAEYLERAIYVCPYCGLSVFESHGNIIKCKKCGIEVSYEPSKELKGKGSEFPYKYVTEWYDYQKDFVNNLDLSEYYEKPLYRDLAMISQVILYERKIKLFETASLTLYGNRIVINEDERDEQTFLFDDINAISVLGRNKLNIYHKKEIYQLKSDKRFNALKYVNIYYRYVNISKGEVCGKFLGL